MLATTAAATTATAAGFTAITSSVVDPVVANAYEKAYPLELQSTPYNEIGNLSNSLPILNEEQLSNKKGQGCGLLAY